MAGSEREAADRHYNCGNDLLKAGQDEAALAEYRIAIALDPQHAAALNNLGSLMRDRGDLDGATDCYQRAIAARPDLCGIYNNLALVELQRHRPLAAVGLLRQALGCTRTDPDSWNYLGGALLAINRPDAALPCFRRAVLLQPDLQGARLGASLALLALGKLSEGWAEYEFRLENPVICEPAFPFKRPRWRGEPIAGKTILLEAEQGLGDTIQFARYAPLVAARGARVVLRVQEPLAPLLAQLAEMTITAKDMPPPFDVHCPLMSLPNVFATDLTSIPATVPYLAADPARRERWARLLGTHRRRRIGLSFSGSAENSDDPLRSIPAGDLVRSLAAPNHELHVLQTDIRPPDVMALAQFPGVTVHADALTDFAETAALAAHMDLIVTIDTSVAHLAGALGLPTWILLPYAADFRWMRDRTDSPWYPTARLFRQPALRAWQPVLAHVAEAAHS